MQTLTQDQFKEKYGTDALAKFSPQVGAQPTAQPSPYDIPSGNYFKSIAQNFMGGVNRIGQGIQEANPLGGGGVSGLITGVGKIAGGAAQSLMSPVAPAFGAVLDKPIQAAGNALSKTKPF